MKKKPEQKEEKVEELVVEEEVDEVLLEMLSKYHPDSFALSDGTYRLVKDYREGFDYEALIKRYNDILAKYDYIVGDWGYDQLRLKGFFKDDFKGAPIDSKVGTLADYLYEYCNFGCAYFVIEQIGDFKRRGRSSQGGKNQGKNKQTAHTHEKKYDTKKGNKKSNYKGKQSQKNQAKSGAVTKKTKTNPAPAKSTKKAKPEKLEKRHFTIKTKEG